MDLVCGCTFFYSYRLCGSHWKLGLPIREIWIVIVIEYFQVIGLLLAVVIFRVVSRVFCVRCFDFEVVEGNLRSMLTMFLFHYDSYLA